MPSSVLAIAAHPGDALFTMGAQVAQQIHAGGRGAFLSLTLGEKGSATIPPARYGAMQREAMEKARKLLGAEADFLSYPDAEVPLNDEASLSVCDRIRQIRPEVVVTHWKGSWHKDHQACYAIVQDAIFYAALRSLERTLPAHAVAKLYFADNWEDSSDFEPDTFVDISSVYDRWLEACAAFPMWRGETGFRYDDYYRSLAVMRGCLGQFQYAVAMMSSPAERQERVKLL